MNYSYPNSDNLDAIKSDGTVITAARATGVTLANSTTYYIPLAHSESAPIGEQASHWNIHLAWASAVTATITFEVTNFPKYVAPLKDRGSVDVSDVDATAGNWVIWNPTAAGPHNISVTGSGNSATAFTITAGGTAAGGASVNLSGMGAKRLRVKIVVTTGGVLRCGVNGKLGA